MSTHRKPGLWSLLAVVAAIWFGGTAGAKAAPAASGGQMLDVGGFHMYIRCEGQGLPVLVLDSGLGGSSSDWRAVQSVLAHANLTCVYDRAGYGRSDSGPLPRTSARIAAELRTLLMRAQLPPPFVLVGHSFGGYNARLFASLFPQDTAGVVLVDTPHEAQSEVLFDRGIIGLLDPQGSLRSKWSPELLASVPEGFSAIAELLGIQAKTWYSVMHEAAAFDISGQELDATPLPSQIPLGVLMHGQRVLPAGPIGDRLEQEWLASNQALVRSQRQGHFAIAPQSGHFIPTQEPERVVDMVRKVLEMASRTD